MKSLKLEKPHAIVMVGIQGSGKTFFASKFSEMFHAPFMNRGEVRSVIVDESATDTIITMMLDEILKTKQSIILELATATKSGRIELAKRLRSAGYIPLFVWVQVDSETALQRSTRQNGVEHSEFETGLRKFAAPTPGEKALVISGKHTYVTQARIVLKKLSSPRPMAPPERPAPTRGQIIIR